MRLVVDDEARAELLEATAFYEEARTGLGSRFVDAVEAGFRRILEQPHCGRRIRGRFRRYLLQQFPYGLIYTVEPGSIYVAAMMHLKRKPGYWYGRARRHDAGDRP